MVSTINVNYQNSIQINKNIYIDPYHIEYNMVKANYIFITHPHYDHYSEEDIKKIMTPQTKFIIPHDLEKEVLTLGISKSNILIVEPVKKYSLDNIEITALPAYNINKKYHPKNNNWLGYLLDIDHTIYYILGDSDVLTEMSNIKCDILFIPVGGIYTMDYKAAAKLTNEIRPKLVIPTHYGPIIPGSLCSATRFSHLLKEINYQIFF